MLHTEPILTLVLTVPSEGGLWSNSSVDGTYKVPTSPEGWKPAHQAGNPTEKPGTPQTRLGTSQTRLGTPKTRQGILQIRLETAEIQILHPANTYLRG